jgi:hypothetical protein
VLLKKLISIGLLFMLLTSNTEFHQLMKLPVLVQHFIHHKALDHSLSFADFIFIHYSDSLESNDQEHHELPFKSHGCQHLAPLVLVCDFPACMAFKITPVAVPTASYQEVFYTCGSLGAIWQPPQLA